MSKSAWATVAVIFLVIPWTLVFAGVLYEYRRMR